MDFLKSVGGKIATGLVSLAVVGAGVAWYETDPAVKQSVLSVTGHLIGWTLLVLALPWAGFAVIGWVAKLDSNGSAAVLIVALTGIEAVLLAWLFNWSIRGSAGWVLYSAAAVIAGVYNLFSCDWIAERVT